MRALVSLTLVVSLVGCRESRRPADKQAAGSGSAKAGSSAAADPWQAIDAQPAPPETPEMRKQRAEKALARVDAIQPRLAKLRGLPFDHPVPTAYQTTDDFRAFLKRELAKELPPEKSQKISAAYLHLGLLKEPIDLA